MHVVEGMLEKEMEVVASVEPTGVEVDSEQKH